MPTDHIGFDPLTIAVFAIVVVICLAIDLFSHRDDKPVSLKDAIIWSLVWIAVSLGFYAFLFNTRGSDTASLFLTGYVLEKALSVDNLMVFVAIFAAFGIPDGLRHRILFYGIIGAMVFRLVFVTIGSALYALGPWVELVFAAIIAWSAVQMLKSGGEDEKIEDYSDHWSVRFTKKIFPVWPKRFGHSFFVGKHDVEKEMEKEENKALSITRGAAWYATPLFLCLVTIEVADIMFAFDSVPAVIAVTKEPLLVYTAMIFAILGLRQLYFVLAAMQKYLVHLAKAVIILLFFIAGKLVLNAAQHLGWTDLHITADQSLAVVLAILALGVLASFIFPQKEEEEAATPADEKQQ